MGNLSGHLIPAIDVEYYGSYIAHPKKTEEVREHLKELLTELETFLPCKADDLYHAVGLQTIYQGGF